MKARCPHCHRDPFGEVALRLNALSWQRFALSSAIILGFLSSVLGLLFGEGSSLVAGLMRQSPLLKVGLTLVLMGIAFSLLVHLVGLWQATRTTTLLHPERGLILLSRVRDGVYLHEVRWHELEPPMESHHRNWLSAFTTFLHLLSGGISHAIAMVLLDNPREFVLGHTTYPNKPIRIITTQGIERERAFFSLLSAYCLKAWLANGRITYDPDYLPSPERPFIVVDLATRQARAYPTRLVLLDETPYEYRTPESYNPDGTRVERDSSLKTPSEQVPDSSILLPAYAVPYEKGYWLRAGWNLISKLEARLKASETATQLPESAPKPV